MLPVSRRVRVVTGRNGVLAPNFAVNPFGYQFASALFLKHAAGCIVGFLLGGMDAGRAIRIVSFVNPVPVWTTRYHAISAFTHSLAFCKTEG
jgi:hypothetical protein